MWVRPSVPAFGASENLHNSWTTWFWCIFRLIETYIHKAVLVLHSPWVCTIATGMQNGDKGLPSNILDGLGLLVKMLRMVYFNHNLHTYTFHISKTQVCKIAQRTNFVNEDVHWRNSFAVLFIIERWMRLDIFSSKSYPSVIPGFVACQIKDNALNDFVW